MSSPPGAAQRFFDAIARRYDRVYAPDRDTSRRGLARVLEALPPAARVLDLGVGTGRELSALLDAGHRPIGVDVSPSMLAICGRRARPVPLLEADFWEALPFDPASFDAVLALHGTLAHPPDEGAYARLQGELWRLLVPGGVLIAEVPSPEWLSALPAEGASSADFRLRRLSPNRCLHEDLVAHVALEATLLSAQEWRAVLASWPKVAIDETASELFVVATRG